MNILIISTEFPPGPGGIGEHAYQLANNLYAMGWQVTVATRQDYVDHHQTEEFRRCQPFNVVPFPDVKLAIYDAVVRWRTVMEQIQARQVDIVIATGLQSVWVASLLPLQVPWIAVGHGVEFGLQGWKHLASRLAFSRAAHVVCVSKYTQQFMLKRDFQPKYTSVIHNGADDSKYSILQPEVVSRYRETLGFSEQDHLLLTVGSVTERKGQEIVIRALPQILREIPNVHYIAVGLPVIQDELVYLSKQLFVSDHVHFLGRVHQDDMVKIYNACDLFVMTSRHTVDGDFEGYGIAVIEAALCGKTAVVAGNSGLAEAVLDQQTGIVVRENDPETVANAVISLLNDDGFRKRLSNNARERAVKEATWTKRVAMYASLFRDVIQT